uniref:Uncharacterized protein n=1 Tax=Arundo donax TaxID=35708 RepID=A0A0A9AEB9_ARUDO
MEREERESQDPPNQKVMMKTFSTCQIRRIKEESKQGHHYTNLATPRLSQQTNKKTHWSAI